MSENMGVIRRDPLKSTRPSWGLSHFIITPSPYRTYTYLDINEHKMFVTRSRLPRNSFLVSLVSEKPLEEVMKSLDQGWKTFKEFQK